MAGINILDPDYWKKLLSVGQAAGSPPPSIGVTGNPNLTLQGPPTSPVPSTPTIGAPYGIAAPPSAPYGIAAPPPPPAAPYGIAAPPGPQYPGLKPGGSVQTWLLQDKLNKAGAGIATDGLMGPQTRAAMAKYGLDASGNPVSVTPVQSVPPSGGGGTPVPVPASAPAGSPGGSNDFLAQLVAQLGPAPSMPSFDPAQVAKDQIQLQYGQQEDALKNALAQLGISYDAGVKEQQTYGKEAGDRLTQVFNALASDLNANQGKTQGYYDTAQQGIGSAYDQAAGTLQKTNSDIVNNLLANADRLGIAQGAGTPLSRIEELYAQMAGSNASRKATSLAGLDTDRANQLALGQSQISSSQRQGAQAQTDLAQQVETALAQLGLQNSQQQGNIYQQQASLENNKAADLRNTTAQLANSLYNQQRQSRLDQLAELIQLGTLDTQRQKLAIDSQTAQNSSALDWAKLAETTRADDLQHQLDALKGNQMDTQTALDQAKLDQLNLGPGPTYGNQLQDFLQTPQEGLWGAGGAGPIFQTVVNDLINKANQQAISPAGGKSGVDPFQYALSQSLNFGANSGHPDINIAGLQEAIRRYYTGKP